MPRSSRSTRGGTGMGGAELTDDFALTSPSPRSNGGQSSTRSKRKGPGSTLSNHSNSSYPTSPTHSSPLLLSTGTNGTGRGGQFSRRDFTADDYMLEDEDGDLLRPEIEDPRGNTESLYQEPFVQQQQQQRNFRPQPRGQRSTSRSRPGGGGHLGSASTTSTSSPPSSNSPTEHERANRENQQATLQLVTKGRTSPVSYFCTKE